MKNKIIDIEEPLGNWCGISLIVEECNSPNLMIKAGGKSRIQLQNHDTEIFWATIHKHYFGVWLLKTYNGFESISQMPIKPIKSNDINSISENKNELRGWCKYFADQLLSSSSSFLYEGKWILQPIIKKKELYESLSISRRYDCKYIFNVENAMNRNQLDWIEWLYENGSAELISLKEKSDTHIGRMKWWRKVAKQGNLPPIFVWYINCLDAFIIIDGHIRLQAAQMEGIDPIIIAAFSINEENIKIDKKRQENICKSMERHPPRNLDEIDRRNETLIEAFDERPYLRAKTVSQAENDFEEKWVNKIKKKLIQIDKTEYINLLLNRERE